RLELALADDALAVDDGTVLAAKIANCQETVFYQQHAVMPTDEVAAGPQLTVFSAHNKEPRPRNTQFLAGVFAYQNLQSYFHLRDTAPQRLRIESKLRESARANPSAEIHVTSSQTTHP